VHTPEGLCAFATHLEAARFGSTAAAPSLCVADVSAFDDLVFFHLALQFEAIASSAEGLLGTLPLSLLVPLLDHGVQLAQLALVQAFAARIAAIDEP